MQTFTYIHTYIHTICNRIGIIGGMERIGVQTKIVNILAVLGVCEWLVVWTV